jgi:hypothetical protein
MVMKFIKNKKFWIAILIIIVFSFGSIASLPKYVPINRDSGGFLYGGQQILNGKLIYRDFWDNKPPVIFFY